MTNDLFHSLSIDFIKDWKTTVDLLDEGKYSFLPLVDSMAVAAANLDYENLYQSYNNLFMPFSKNYVSPYEMECVKDTPSHSMTVQAELSDVAGFYNAFGLTTSTNAPDRVDHISTQLEFMHYMALKESEAIENQNLEHLEIVCEAEKKFMTDHLGRWATIYAERIEKQDSNGFYGALSRLLTLWIETDLLMIYEN